MAESNETLDNINSSLQSMAEINKQMIKQLDYMNEKAYNPMYNYNKKIYDVEQKRMKGQKEQVHMLKDMAGKTKEIFMYITSAKIAISLIDIVKSTFEIEQHMMQLGVRMGKAREGGKELYKQFANIQKETGRSAEQAKEMVTILASNKFQGNIEKVGAHMLRFAHATGLTDSEAGQLAVNLSRVGGLGDKSLMQITAGMAKVQQRVGISAEGMSALADSISISAHNMIAFGKTEQDIKQMTIRTTALVAALEKVGVRAQETIQLIEQLTDPERIEDNIALYSQLGISIQDALNGGDITEQLGSGLQEMASKAAAMGPIAGAQYAKAFGMSYKQLMKVNQTDIMGEMSKTAEDMVPEDPQKMMIELQKNVKTTLDHIYETIYKFEGFLRGFGPIILTAIAMLIAFAPIIGKKIASIFTPRENKALASAQTDLEKGVEDSLSMAGEKGGERLKAYLSKIKLPEVGKGAVSNTLGEYQVQQLEKSQQILVEIQQSVKKQREELDNNIKNRKKQLEQLRTEISLNTEINGATYQAQKSAEKSLMNQILYDEQRDTILENYVNKQENFYNLEKQIEDLSSDGLRTLQKRAETELTIAKEKENALSKQQEATKKQLKDNELIDKQLEHQIALYTATFKEINTSTAEGLEAFARISEKIDHLQNERTKMATLQDELNQKLNDEKSQMQSITDEVQKRKDAETQITKEYDKRVKDGLMNPAANGGFVNTLKKTVDAIRSSMVSGFKGVYNSVSSRFSKLITDVKMKLKDIQQHPIKAGISGLKGLSGIMGKLIGPMAILGLIMKLVQPVLENLQNVLKPLLSTFQGVFGKLFSTLITSLLPPILQLLKFLWPILTKIVWVAGLLISGIGHLIKGLGYLIPPLKGVGDGLIGAGGGLMALQESNDEVKKQIDLSTEDVKKSNLANTQATEENTAAQNNGPQDYYANGSGFSPAVTNASQSTQSTLAAQKANDAQKARDNNVSISAAAATFSLEIEKRIAEGIEGVQNLLSKMLNWMETPRLSLSNNSAEGTIGFGGPTLKPGETS
jgi:hypothetical protein